MALSVSTVGDSPRIGPHAAMRTGGYVRSAIWGVLTVMLVAEMVGIRLPYDSTAVFPTHPFAAQLLVFFQRSVEPTFATTLLVASFLSVDTLCQEYRRVFETSTRSPVALPWLAAHLGFLAPLALGTLAKNEGQFNTVVLWEGWLLLWALLGSGMLACWCFAILPPIFWIRYLRRSWTSFAVAGAIGFAAFTIGYWVRNLWWPLQRSTFETVDFLLRMTGLQAIVLPKEFVIGTTNFTVNIAARCSGLEGIGLITVMATAYLWYYRRDLLFPRALLLIPIGALAMWLVNAGRIAALIMIGNWSGEVAATGFHSVAGWLLFNLVACGLIWATTHFRLFARTNEEHAAGNPAVAYLLPFLLLITSAIVTHAFAPLATWFYPFGALAALGVIGFYWADLDAMTWRISWLPIAAGAAVCALWILSGAGHVLTALLLEPGDLPRRGSSLLPLTGIAVGSLAMAIAEELAFRGYLLRRLIAPDFENVEYTQFAWWPVIGSSIAYGIVHAHWLAATVVGMIFGGVVYYRGRLADAIIAHFTATVLLFAYVIAR